MRVFTWCKRRDQRQQMYRQTYVAYTTDDTKKVYIIEQYTTTREMKNLPHKPFSFMDDGNPMYNNSIGKTNFFCDCAPNLWNTQNASYNNWLREYQNASIINTTEKKWSRDSVKFSTFVLFLPQSCWLANKIHLNHGYFDTVYVRINNISMCVLVVVVNNLWH